MPLHPTHISDAFSEGLIHIDSLPEGILHLMLVDSLGLPLTERLVYVSHPELRPAWKVRPDKASYEKREKVKVDLELDRPEFFSNYYSVSVTDRSTVYYDSLSENINSYLFVTSDLKGYVHNAGYYFIDNSPARMQKLDLVMLTNGWRRFKANTKPANKERSIKAMEIGLDRIKRKSLYSSRFAMFCHIYQNARRGSIMQGFRYQVITCSDVA